MKNAFIVLVALLLFVSPVFAQNGPQWRVDEQGNLTVDGEIFRVTGGSWTGLEGRHAPSDSMSESDDAGMELYIGNVFWAESGRTYDQNIAEFKEMGLNLIRLSLVPQTLDPDDLHGQAPYLKNHDSVIIENSRLALETVISKLDAADIFVLLDIHSCSNYIGWRAGRLDARPPYPDRDWDSYDFPREDCSCSATNNPAGADNIQPYDESQWLANLRELAGLGAELGVTNIMGIDIFNEPWDYTWAEWRSMIDKAYEAVNSVNPNILIFAGGVSVLADTQDGTPDTVTRVRHGAEDTIPCLGENLYEAGENPPSMPKDRLVFSPHAFGPSMYVQKMFMDPDQPECEGLEGEEAGDVECNIVINQALLERGWDEHFGYLKRLGYAVVIGAWGGNPDWPNKAEERMQDRYKYLTDTTVDLQWQEAFVEYLLKRGITDTIYWSINPEVDDTHDLGGLYVHAYDPISNTVGWGTWEAPDQRKLDLLQRLRNPPPPTLPNTGDVNGDNRIDIVDALMIAQHYVGLTPPGFIDRNGDVNCDGSITIIDALMTAQYYVGLLSFFHC